RPQRVRAPDPLFLAHAAEHLFEGGAMLGLGGTPVLGRPPFHAADDLFVDISDVQVDGHGRTPVLANIAPKRFGRYIRSGVSMPSRSRAMTSWSSVALASARREPRLASSGAASTGQAA